MARDLNKKRAYQRKYNKIYWPKYYQKNRNRLLIAGRKKCYANKERNRLSSKRYYYKNKERINKQGLKERFKLLIKFNFTCQYCGRKAPEVILEIDHIIPKSKGGLTKETNLTVACRECNSGKSNLLIF